ncbi:MAG: sigma-54-dependent Fis family transcriptional regulator [Spirochaetales bacterium]|nr:sigma-54-dependent Fis family transcriptional regulator [Spirochaetales bacterium]
MIKNPTYPILVVDDDEEVLQSMDRLFFSRGFNNYILCQDSRKVSSLLQKQKFSIVLLDLIMPYVAGQEILDYITNNYPQILIIVITASDDILTAVECMKAGAFDFLLKPISRDILLKVIKRALDIIELKRENKQLKDSVLSEELKFPEVFSHIITGNSVMKRIFHYMEAIAHSLEPVLITGEHGTGKELIVRTLHALSNREGELVVVDVAGLDDIMFTDTLFGHKKGAYTDAKTERRGLIARAQNGTLFLDEIGDMRLQSQSKLLRLIQEKEYYPLGSDIPVTSKARVILATNKNLPALIATEQFKQDLYYRLNTHCIHMPPLRERKEDIPLLIKHFVRKVAKEYGRKEPFITEKVISLLSHYDFPGNIRELESIIKDAIFKSEGTSLSFSAIETKLDKKFKTDTHQENSLNEIPDSDKIIFPAHLPTLKDVENELIKEVIKRNDGNIARAAKILGVTRQALSYRLKKIKND